VIDLRLRFGLDKIQPTPNSRLVVVSTRGAKLGLIVEKVESILKVSEADISLTPEALPLQRPRYLYGSLEMTDGRILFLLDHEELIDEQDFPSSLQNQLTLDSFAEPKLARRDPPSQLSVLHFTLASEHCALETSHVDEVIDLPTITASPGHSPFIRGLIYLRGVAIPIVNLRKRLDLTPLDAPEDQQVIILKEPLFGVKVGLLVDAVHHLLLLSKPELMPPPLNLNPGRINQLIGVFYCRQLGEKPIVMLLKLEALLSIREQHALREAESIVPAMEAPGVSTILPIGMLEFMINGEKFALSLRESKEVVQVPPVTAIPQASPFIRGIINLRGETISLVDLPKMAAAPVKMIDRKSRLVVVMAAGEKIALLVDEVVGIRHRVLSTFKTPADCLRRKGSVFVQGVCEHRETGEMILLLDLKATLEEAKVPRKCVAKPIDPRPGQIDQSCSG